MEFIKPNWNAPTNIKALTTTRLGGVSSSPYDSLNLGDHVGDEKSSVEQNRQRLCDDIRQSFQLSPEAQFKPQWIRQEHTINIVDDYTNDQQTCAYDGQFTQGKGVVCTIMTADCMPVFICNKQGSEIALVHAGWRGLAEGIVEKAINLFSDQAEQLLVHCGPAISQQYFEIGHDVKQELGGAEQFYRANADRAGHYYADLYGLLGEKMHDLGIEYTHSSDCTFADQERLFSYRREGVTGRTASLIWIE